MTGEAIDYEDVLRRWKCNRIQAANDLERLLLRDELPSPGSVARAIVTLREEPGWISVKDRFPKRGQKVLVYRPKMAVKVMETEFDGEFFAQGMHDLRGNVVITHWIPLPEFPKEESK